MLLDDFEDDMEDEVKVDTSNVINDECGKVHTTTIKNISDVRICTKNLSSCDYLSGDSLAIKTGELLHYFSL